MLCTAVPFLALSQGCRDLKPAYPILIRFLLIPIPQHNRMPFWSKKGKERAVEPESERSFTSAFWPRVEPEPVEPQLPSYRSELWEREADRLMEEHKKIVRETGRCSRQSLIAEEMAMEVRDVDYSCIRRLLKKKTGLQHVCQRGDHSNKRPQGPEPGESKTDPDRQGYSRRDRTGHSTRSLPSSWTNDLTLTDQHMHEACCCTQAAKDERLAWLVRSDRSFRKDRPLWDRQPDESGKTSKKKVVADATEREREAEGSELPSYNEAVIDAAFSGRL